MYDKIKKINAGAHQRRKDMESDHQIVKFASDAIRDQIITPYKQATTRKAADAVLRVYKKIIEKISEAGAYDQVAAARLAPRYRAMSTDALMAVQPRDTTTGIALAAELRNRGITQAADAVYATTERIPDQAIREDVDLQKEIQAVNKIFTFTDQTWIVQDLPEQIPDLKEVRTIQYGDVVREALHDVPGSVDLINRVDAVLRRERSPTHDNAIRDLFNTVMKYHGKPAPDPAAFVTHEQEAEKTFATAKPAASPEPSPAA